MKKISIILPVYNVEKYLSECLDSLINQSYSNLEIICVNDASTDKSANILLDYSKIDSRIKLINLPENKGQGVARNEGLKNITGDYIAFVDPDDWCTKNYIETLYNCSIQNDADIVCSCAIIYNDENKNTKNINFIKGTIINQVYNWQDVKDKNLLCKNIPACWGKLYKTSLIKKNSITFGKGRFAEDAYFTIRTLITAKKIINIDQHLYYYRQQVGSTLANLKKYNLSNQVELVKETKEFLIEKGAYDDFKIAFINSAIGQLTKAYKNLDDSQKQIFKENVKQNLDNEIYRIFCKKIRPNVFKHIFAIGNKSYGASRYKVLTICGFNFRLKKIY